MLLQSADGTVYGLDGRVLHFSAQRFYDDVVRGRCCFVCGRAPSKKVRFNDEHVIPRWILKRYGMFNQTIGLPNGGSATYGTYTVPCCLECNALLGRTFEEPMRELLSGGMSEFRKRLTPTLGRLLFCWCSLIFLKTHMKDLRIKWDPDPRKNKDYKIGQTYDWQALHHIQCMARAPAVGTDLGYGSIGTLILREARSMKVGRYDYGDLSFAYTTMLQLDDVVIFAVLNDSKICERIVEPDFRRLGRLSPLQTRELVAWLASINVRLSPRPKFRTELDGLEHRSIVAEVPETFDLAGRDDAAFGGMLDFLLKDWPLEPALREEVKKGQGSFVFRDTGEFIEHDFFVDPQTEEEEEGKS